MIDFVSPFFFKGKGHAWFFIFLKALSNKVMTNGFGVCTINVVKKNLFFFHFQITQIDLEKPLVFPQNNPNKFENY
jgi:hypothetical protein